MTAFTRTSSIVELGIIFYICNSNVTCNPKIPGAFYRKENAK
jgi:hypothetical protein